LVEASIWRTSLKPTWPGAGVWAVLGSHGPVIIDFPQAVDLVLNPHGFDLLHHDVTTMCTWFTRQGIDCDAESLYAEIRGVSRAEIIYPPEGAKDFGLVDQVIDKRPELAGEK